MKLNGIFTFISTLVFTSILTLMFLSANARAIENSDRAAYTTSSRENFLEMSVDINGLRYLPNEKQLEFFCTQQKGKVINEWTCPATKVIRKDGPFCVLSDQQGRIQVTNGCTGTYGLAPEFFRACVMHDMCYHNHGVMNGGTKEACDEKFIRDMYETCDSYIGDSAVLAVTCYAIAHKAFYGAVHFFGRNSWNCAAENVEYPQSLREQ